MVAEGALPRRPIAVASRARRQDRFLRFVELLPLIRVVLLDVMHSSAWHRAFELGVAAASVTAQMARPILNAKASEGATLGADKLRFASVERLCDCRRQVRHRRKVRLHPLGGLVPSEGSCERVKSVDL